MSDPQQPQEPARARGATARPLAALGRLGVFFLVALVAGAVAAAMVLPVAAATGLLTRGAIDSFESLPSQLDAPDLPERSVILASDGSTDDTVAKARAAGARVEHQEWLGYSSQKTMAIARATQPWVLLLDADEWLEPAAQDAVRALFADGRVEAADAWRKKNIRAKSTTQHIATPPTPEPPAIEQEGPYRPAEASNPIDTATAAIDPHWITVKALQP